MIVAHCPSCQRLTGHKRALGWGTFFAVVLTGGVWLLALPFYESRCVICGLTGEPRPLPQAPMKRSSTYNRVTVIVLGALIAGILLVAWLAPK